MHRILRTSGHLAPTLFALTLLLGAVYACGTGSQSQMGARWEAVYDTIGDTVVVRTVAGSLWGGTATLVPEVTIGVLDGPEEYMFGRIVSMALGPDGTIYVMDQQAPALRVYDPDGTYRATFGREGAGPGEYRRPDGGLGVLSDGRIVLRDPSNARIQVFAPDGEALDTWPIRGGFNTSRRMVVDTEDRSHVMLLMEPDVDVRDWQMGLLQILPDGSHGDTLTPPDTDFEEQQLEARYTDGDNNSVSTSSVPFTAQEHWQLTPMGYFIHGISESYAVTLLRNDAPALRIERDYEPIPVAGGERSEEEAAMTQNMRETQPNWRWNGAPIPDHKPPYRNLLTGEDGTVWVLMSQPAVRVEDSAYDPSDPESIPDEWHEPILFDVFDAEGAYLGAVKAPDGFSTYPTPLLTREWVLGVVRDEFDVQRVIRFKVEHPTGAQTGDE
jgi:hypothetical protein